MAALVTVEQQSGNAATMGLLLSYALQVGPLCHAGLQRCLNATLNTTAGMVMILMAWLTCVLQRTCMRLGVIEAAQRQLAPTTAASQQVYLWITCGAFK
jgi:hypothetical protein